MPLYILRRDHFRSGDHLRRCTDLLRKCLLLRPRSYQLITKQEANECIFTLS